MNRNEIIEVAKQIYTEHFNEREIAFARMVIEQCRKQTQQKPVAWIRNIPPEPGADTSVQMTSCDWVAIYWPDAIPLYAAPREWQGLTGDEVAQLTAKHSQYPFALTAAIEAKLKEKNS